MTQTIKGYSIVFIPYSWALGAWHRPHKSIYAFGPFRYVRHNALGEWKGDAPQPEFLSLDDHEAEPLPADPPLGAADPVHGLDAPHPGWHARCLGAADDSPVEDRVDARGTKYAINPNGYAPHHI